MLDTRIAAALGRPDQARTRMFATSGDSSVREPGTASGAVQASARLADMGATISANLDSGRVSAGILAAMILSLVAFYVWTRGHQAVVALFAVLSLVVFRSVVQT